MVAKCSRCGAESPDGSVFCDVCGDRIVVGLPDGHVDDSPFYAYQWMGATHILTFSGWAIRWLAPQMFIVCCLAIGALALGGFWLFILVVQFAFLYLLVWALLVRFYRLKGRPTDFGGAGRSPHPSASSSEAMESDFSGPSGSRGSGAGDVRGDAYSLSPKRR